MADQMKNHTQCCWPWTWPHIQLMLVSKLQNLRFEKQCVWDKIKGVSTISKNKSSNNHILLPAWHNLRPWYQDINNLSWQMSKAYKHISMIPFKSKKLLCEQHMSPEKIQHLVVNESLCSSHTKLQLLSTFFTRLLATLIFKHEMVLKITFSQKLYIARLTNLGSEHTTTKI